MKALYIAIMLCLSSLVCYAAFPVKQEDKVVAATAAQQHTEQPHPTTAQPSDPEQNGVPGVVAAILGGVSLLSTALGLTIINAPGALILTGLITGILAIIYGSKGSWRKNKGWAITGLAAGILSLTAIVVLFLVALFLVLLVL